MSGNVADHDDTMSTCSVFPETPADLVPAPLPPPQTRSYASAIKRTDSPLDVEGTPLSIETDLCIDSGVEMKSGSSTGSDGYDSVKEPLSPSPTMGSAPSVMPLLPPTPSTTGSTTTKRSMPAGGDLMPETPKTNRGTKQRKPMSFEMSLSLFQSDVPEKPVIPDMKVSSKAQSQQKRKLTVSTPPGLEGPTSQLLTPAVSPSTASFRFPDLRNHNSSGDSSLLTPASDLVKGCLPWSPLCGSGFMLGETLLGQCALPGW